MPFKTISFPKIIVSILAVSIIAVFVTRAVTMAKHKSFWMDETFAINTVTNMSFSQMIFRGLPGQGSPAPLDYIVLKLASLSKKISLLPETIHYRLHTIFFTVFAGLVSFLFLFRRIKNFRQHPWLFCMQAVFFLAALVSFLFTFYNFYYAIETRPYALWNA
ncbi:MAG: hypothetical protein KC618_07190, partial [Candidatus Omnitrophica bacterium]|nr:hypothetical protein [Candidatus Omnitrophota bacterium]